MNMYQTRMVPAWLIPPTKTPSIDSAIAFDVESIDATKC